MEEKFICRNLRPFSFVCILAGQSGNKSQVCAYYIFDFIFLFGAYEFIFICSTSDKDGVRFNVVIFVYFISFSSLCALVNHCSCWIPWKSSLVFMCDKWACISSLYHKFGLKHVRKSACFFFSTYVRNFFSGDKYTNCPNFIIHWFGLIALMLSIKIL